jgi:hypothetical protein
MGYLEIQFGGRLFKIPPADNHKLKILCFAFLLTV